MSKELRVNSGVAIFFSLTLVIGVLKYVFDVERAFSNLYILYFLAIWQFNREVTIWKFVEKDKKVKKKK